MSVTHVGSNVVDKGVFDNNAIAISVPAGIAAGLLAILEVATDGNPLTTVTDSRGNTWTIAVQNNSAACNGICYSVLTTGLQAGDTISIAATNNRRWFWSLEKVDSPTATPLDTGSASASGLQGAGAPSWVMTNGVSGDTAFSILAVAATTGSYNGQAGWTGLAAGNAAATFSAGCDYKEQTVPPLTVAPSWSLDRNWNGVSAGFKIQAAAAGGGGWSVFNGAFGLEAFNSSKNFVG